jgi:ubiquitin carboxyl-terminal hydrolase 5/13
MASVLQTLFALPAFRAAYSPDRAAAHWAACPEPLPAGCVQCQMLKVGDGLLSGRYAVPAPPALDSLNKLAHESPADAFQAGLRPAGFKALLGRGHAEFGSMRQQDAEEFLSFLLDALRRDARRTAPNPALDAFRFGTQSRLECRSCHGVRYREDAADVLSIPVPAREKGKDGEGKTLWHDVQLEECLGAALGAEELEYHCPACARGVAATKSTRLASFPAVLVLHAKKFQLVNWVPTKLGLSLPTRTPAHGLTSSQTSRCFSPRTTRSS